MLQSLFASPSYRYARDFISIGALGAGGFGHVVAARNLLDGQKYAVKHVRFDYYNSTTCLEVGAMCVRHVANIACVTQVLREVRTLSQLYHPHIVRYHTAWVEMELLTAPTGRTCDDEAAGYSGVDGAHMLDLRLVHKRALCIAELSAWNRIRHFVACTRRRASHLRIHQMAIKKLVHATICQLPCVGAATTNTTNTARARMIYQMYVSVFTPGLNLRRHITSSFTYKCSCAQKHCVN
jgi:hypothetical protein